MRDRYELHEELGRGSMGVVFRATDRELGRGVAVKVLTKGLAADAEGLARFKREIAAAAAVSHPHVIRIFDSGVSEGAAFFTMELVDGVTLEHQLEEDGRIRWDDVAEMLGQIGDALGALHARRIIHRDVKNANIMRRGDGHCTLMDFGLAHIPDRSVLTEAGRVMGTPLYMAPEIWRGEPHTSACDVYSLGIVAWRTLTGLVPTNARRAGELAAWAMQSGPPPLAEVMPEAPLWLSALVDRMVRLEPSQRATAEEVVETCRRHAAGSVMSGGQEASPVKDMRPRTKKSRPVKPSTDIEEQPTVPIVRTRRKRPRISWLAAAGLGALAAVGVALALRRPAQPPPPSTPAQTAPAPDVPGWCAVRWPAALPSANGVLVDFSLDPPCAAVVRIRAANRLAAEVRLPPARRFHHVFSGLATDTEHTVDVELGRAPDGARGLVAYPFRTLKMKNARTLDDVADYLRQAPPEAGNEFELWNVMLMRLMRDAHADLYHPAGPHLARAIDRARDLDARKMEWAANNALELRSPELLRVVVQKVTSDEDPDMLTALLSAAVRLGDPSAPAIAERLLKLPSPELEHTRLDALASALPATATACDRFAQSLVRWGPERAYEAAAALCKIDRDAARAHFQRWAASAFSPARSWHGARAEPGERSWLQANSTTLMGLYGLAQLGKPDDVAFLVRVLNAKESPFRAQAAFALSDVATPAAAAALVRVTETDPGFAAGHWSAAVVNPAAALRTGTPVLTSHRDQEAAAAVASALGRTFDAAPLPEATARGLIGMLTSTSASSVKLAAFALGRRHEHRAYDQLRALALSERDPHGVAGWAFASIATDVDTAALARLCDTLIQAGPGAGAPRLAMLAAGLAEAGRPAARPALARLATAAGWPPHIRALAAPAPPPPGSRVLPVFPFVCQQTTGMELRAGEILSCSWTGVWLSPEGQDQGPDESPVRNENRNFPLSVRLRGQDGVWASHLERRFVAERDGEVIVSPTYSMRADPWWPHGVPESSGVVFLTLRHTRRP